jgi:hypothetical protein
VTQFAFASLTGRALRQWLVGIHADTGELSISFQYMHHPPFDTDAGREPLRAMLNEIRASPSLRTG